MDEFGEPIGGASFAFGAGPSPVLVESSVRSSVNGEWVDRVELPEERELSWALEVRAREFRTSRIHAPFLPADGLDLGSVVLERATLLSGVVVTATGGPVEDAQVVIRRLGHDGRELGSNPKRQFTASDGRFAFQVDRSPDLAKLRVRVWHSTLGGPSSLDVPLLGERHSYDVVIELVPTGIVEGVVVDLDGNPIAGATITASSLDWFDAVQAHTDERGSFVIPVASDLQVWVHAEHESYLPSPPHNPAASPLPGILAVAGDHVQLHMTRACSLEVVARDSESGAPISEFEVSFCALDANVQRCFSGSGIDGVAKMKGLPPGKWQPVRVSAAGYEDWLFSVVTQQVGEHVGPVEVFPQKLAEGYGVLGRVADAGERAVEGAVIELFRRVTSRGSRMTVVESAGRVEAMAATHSDSDGMFHFARVPSGSYLLRAETEPHGELTALAEFVHESGDSDLGDLLVAPGGSLTGKLVADAPTQLGGALLKLLPARGLARSALLKAHVAQSDADGSFSFEQVPPGRYELEVWFADPPSRGIVFAPWTGVDLTHAVPTKYIEVPLAVATSVHGYLPKTVSLDGDAHMRARRTGLLGSRVSWGLTIRGSRSGAVAPDGSFAIEGLHPGVYELTLEERGVVKQRWSKVIVPASMRGVLSIDL